MHKNALNEIKIKAVIPKPSLLLPERGRFSVKKFMRIIVAQNHKLTNVKRSLPIILDYKGKPQLNKAKD